MQYIKRCSELTEEEVNDLFNKGYLKVKDEEGMPEGDNEYLYDPHHWCLTDGITFNYMFDNIMFQSLTKEALEQAVDEGFGQELYCEDYADNY